MSAYIVRLSKEELDKAHEIVKTRGSGKNVPGRNRRVMNEKDSVLDFYGAVSEIAVGRLLHVPVDENRYEHGDNGVDLVKNGKIYAVKYNTHPTNPYLYFWDKPLHWDYGVLTIRWNPFRLEIQVVGWIDMAGFLKLEEKVNFTHKPDGDRRAVHLRKMHSIHTLPGKGE